jgi:hypothetical protein
MTVLNMLHRRLDRLDGGRGERERRELAALTDDELMAQIAPHMSEPAAFLALPREEQFEACRALEDRLMQ